MPVCPSCGSAVPSQLVSEELGVAQCPACDSMFETVGTPAATEPVAVASAVAPADRRLPGLSAPSGVEVARSGAGLVVTWRWPRTTGALLLAFSIPWFGFLGLFFGNALEGDDPMFVLVPMALVVVGLVVLYTGVAHLVNHTTVVVARGALEIEHGPLPWPGRMTLRTESLSQLYVDRRVVRTKNSHRIVFDVRARRAGGGDIKLLSGFDDAEPARFFERAIELHLGIEDRPVGGEY